MREGEGRASRALLVRSSLLAGIPPRSCSSRTSKLALTFQAVEQRTSKFHYIREQPESSLHCPRVWVGVNGAAALLAWAASSRRPTKLELQSREAHVRAGLSMYNKYASRSVCVRA